MSTFLHLQEQFQLTIEGVLSIYSLVCFGAAATQGVFGIARFSIRDAN